MNLDEMFGLEADAPLVNHASLVVGKPKGRLHRSPHGKVL